MKSIQLILSLLFILNTFAEEAKVNEDHVIIRSYYKLHNNWEFEKLLNLFHEEFIIEASKQIKIKPEEFKAKMLFYFKKKMKLQYKSKEEFKKKNTYKIEHIELDYEENGSKVYIVTTTGKTNGVSNHVKMFYVLKEKLIVSMGTYQAYQNLQIENELKQKTP